MKNTVGIIGNGFVGSAVLHAFKHYCDVKVYDKDPRRCINSEEETINQDIVFVCVPTPMTDAEGGECNLSIIEETLASIEHKNKRTDNVFVIKSTVPIGTTKKLQDRYKNLNIIHSPEFLTARNAKVDFLSASRHIIGIPDLNNDISKNLYVLYKDRFPGSQIIVMSSDESEFVKYASNCFFATKVMYFNEIKLLSDKLNLDWNLIMQGILSDGRISQSHVNVPGYDGDRGFGGTCFPKDINAFIRTMESCDIDPLLLKSAWQQNKNVRKNWDWAHNESAVKNKSI